jgi:excisionase family DNA binding protein
MTSWLTVAQVAEIAGFTRDTVRHAIADGRLRASKPPGTQQWRILPDDLEAWFVGGVTQPVISAPPPAPPPQRRGRDRPGSVARLDAIERGRAA